MTKLSRHDCIAIIMNYFQNATERCAMPCYHEDKVTVTYRCEYQYNETYDAIGTIFRQFLPETDSVFRYLLGIEGLIKHYPYVKDYFDFDILPFMVELQYLHDKIEHWNNIQGHPFTAYDKLQVFVEKWGQVE